MDENVYYDKKINIKKFILPALSVILVLGLFYFLNFFNINPNATLSLINNGNMKAEHARDYIFSISSKNASSFPELQIIINEETNTDMSEAMQHISLSSGDNVFDWDRFFKFNTGLIKTPYDTRYIKFENLEGEHAYNYNSNESDLAAMLTKTLNKKSNFLFDRNKYEDKKIKINMSGVDFTEKVKLHYTVKFTDDEASNIFIELYDKIWNSNAFGSFFKLDNEIQKKLNIENSTKAILDIIHNIKENSTIKELTVGIVANKNYVESIVYDFSLSYNDGKTTHELKLSFGEYLKPLADGYSPESIFEPLSTVDFNALKEYEKHEIDDEVKIDETFGYTTNNNDKKEENGGTD